MKYYYYFIIPFHYIWLTTKGSGEFLCSCLRKDHEAVLQRYQLKLEDYKECYEKLPLAKKLAESLKLKEELLFEYEEKIKELKCLKQEKQILECMFLVHCLE